MFRAPIRLRLRGSLTGTVLTVTARLTTRRPSPSDGEYVAYALRMGQDHQPG